LALAIGGMFAAVCQATVITHDDPKSLNNFLSGAGTWTYSHEMLNNISVPLDTIFDAELRIGYKRALAIGYLSVNGPAVPGSPGIYWGANTADFDLESILNPWTQGSPLWVNGTGLGTITPLTSNLHLVNDAISAPVPGPGMMMLLGTVLVGLAVYGRKKFRKEYRLTI
jgi:hypothetical protein